MLSLDRNILKNGSLVQKRLLALAGTLGRDNVPPEPFKEGLGAPLGRGDTTPASHFSEKVGGTPFDKGELTVLVPGERDEELKVSEHLTVHSVAGIKPVQFFKMWRLAKSLILNHLSLTMGEKATTPTLADSGTPFGKGDNNPRTSECVAPFGKGELKRHDLITVQDTSYLVLLAYLLARKFSIPFEIQVHGLERFTGLRKYLAEFLLPRADRVRVVSERLRRYVSEELKVKSEKLYTLPVYTQTGEKEETRERGRKRKGLPYPFTFLTVGRLVPVKNIAMQIRAFARLVEAVPHVLLRIIGDGPERSNLQLITDNLQLTDKIIFEGTQEDTSRFYREADAFLLTSDSEGYGVAVTEAAAYKLPIIMTNVGLAGEFIRHNENGIVIPVGDEAELFGAMREVLQSPELRVRLGAAAFRAFKSLPSREEQIEKQVEEWRGLQ